MIVTVKLFGPEAKAAGLRAVAVDLGDASENTCLSLRERLVEQIPELSGLMPNCRFAVNHEFVDLTCPLLPSDEIALIGMVSGG